MTSTRFKPYPETKDSGTEWLGQIPAHWEVKRLKHLSALQTGGTPPGVIDTAFDEGGVPWVKPDDLLADHGISRPEKAVTREEATKLGVSPEGSALVCGIGTVGKFGWAPSNVCTNQQINSVAFHGELLPRFGQFAMWGLRFEFERRANKVTIAICNKSSMGEAQLPVPPASEQQAIADFLDRETAKIDALVEKKDQLIELLQEKRIALITHVVTGEIDVRTGKPYPAYKPSLSACGHAPAGGTCLRQAERGRQAEWLGQIPVHWVELELKFALEEPITDGPHETPEFLDEGIPFLSAEAVKDDRLDFERKRGFISDEDHLRFSRKYSPKRGDVYMVKSGATTGNVARVETDEVFDIWSPLAAMRPDNSRVSTDFLFYFLKSEICKKSVELSWSFGTQQNIGMGVLSNLRVVLPPGSEQEAITKHLDLETVKIDALIAKVGEAIERLKEYRTALISAAVTGKIDVRGLVSAGGEGSEVANEG